MKMESITTRVKRWDIYDIADELADVPGLLNRALTGDRVAAVEVKDLAYELERKLWLAAERGGSVGPYPEYESWDAEDLTAYMPANAFRGVVYGLGLSAFLWVLLAAAWIWMLAG